MFEGKTFSTPLLVQTDIHGGGHFFYVTHKKKLQFLENGYVELSYEVIDDHWASPGQYGNVLFSGTYNQPGISVRFKIMHIRTASHSQCNAGTQGLYHSEPESKSRIFIF